ncbi:MAG: hypothetical protein AAGE52_22175 [Myxococcota bacterium]
MRLLGLVFSLFLVISGCKAGVGDSCFEENDCEGSLLCCKASFDPNTRGTCDRSCDARDAGGGGTDSGAADTGVDAGEDTGVDAGEDAGEDASVDAATEDATTDGATEDAAADAATEDASSADAAEADASDAV